MSDDDWMDYVHPLPVRGTATAKATYAPLPESKWDLQMETKTDTLNDADAEKLERLGFEDLDGESIGIVLSGTSYGWYHHPEGGDTIDAALIGILTDMAVEKGWRVEFSQSTPNPAFPTSRPVQLYDGVVFICRSASYRERFDGLVIAAANDPHTLAMQFKSVHDRGND